MDVVGDIQATGVNYEKVYPAKRRRLTVPALASPDKEPHAHINDGEPQVDITSDSPEREDIESSDGSEGERAAQAVMARGINGKDALTVSFDSDSSSDDDYASAKTEHAAAAKAVLKYIGMLPRQSPLQQDRRQRRATAARARPQHLRPDQRPLPVSNSDH